jgi:CRP/FNR family cyclic AMP-dependent transcriptional regulator
MDEEEVVGDRIVHSLVTALRNVPEFGGLDERTQLRIVGASANLFWPEGSTIFQRGAPAEALYIVLRGAVAVLDEADGREVEAARIGPGDYFGEMSLLLHTTHTKSARAAEDTELMVVPKESFQALLSSTPELAEHFRRKIEQRMPGGAPGKGLDVESTDDTGVPSAERTDG